MKGLTSRGFRIPQDISVTGFDRTRLAEYSNPSITTVDVHRDLLGKIAADALNELCSSTDPHGKEYEISAELIVGNSSGPVG
jgi:DNA-binding LacI/PurR family transcriptional regulator